MTVTFGMSGSLNGWSAACCYPLVEFTEKKHLLLWSQQKSNHVSCIICYISIALAAKIPIKGCPLPPPHSAACREKMLKLLLFSALSATIFSNTETIQVGVWQKPLSAACWQRRLLAACWQRRLSAACWQRQPSKTKAYFLLQLMKHMSALSEGGPARNKIKEGNRSWNKRLEVEIQEKDKRGRRINDPPPSLPTWVMDGRIRIMRWPQETRVK